MPYMLNENIKRLRLAAGYNQVEFAKLLNVTKQCVSNWENDNVVPSIEMMIKIADIFNVTTDYLLGRCETKLLDVSNLTDLQSAHISMIIKDFSALNVSK